MQLDYESLRKIKPNLIMISSCLMGQTGPLRDLAGFGNLSAAIAAFYDLTSWPDRPPAGPPLAYTDCLATRYIAVAILAALEYREERLLRSVANRLRSRLADGMDSFQALNECQDHVVTLARAHIERVLLGRMQDGVAHAPTPGLSAALGTVSALYALSRIEAHSGWYLETGYLEPAKSRAVRSEVSELCRELRPHARLLVDAFGVPEALLPELVAVR